MDKLDTERFVAHTHPLRYKHDSELKHRCQGWVRRMIGGGFNNQPPIDRLEQWTN